MESGEQSEESVVLKFRIRQKRKAFMKVGLNPNSQLQTPKPRRHMVKLIGKSPGTPGGNYDLGSCVRARVRELKKVFQRPQKGKMS